MTPKEDQQPMTTREELVGLADRVEHHVGFFACQRMPISLAEWDRISNDLLDAAKFVRLASRQELSVEELGLALRLVALDELPPAYFKRGSDVRKAIARDMARALLAEYVITKRTTEE